jgi:hypothetical protein
MPRPKAARKLCLECDSTVDSLACALCAMCCLLALAAGSLSDCEVHSAGIHCLTLYNHDQVPHTMSSLHMQAVSARPVTATWRLSNARRRHAARTVASRCLEGQLTPPAQFTSLRHMQPLLHALHAMASSHRRQQRIVLMLLVRHPVARA